MISNPLESIAHITAKNWACSKTENERSDIVLVLRIVFTPRLAIIVEFTHNHVIWVSISGMMGFIEYQKPDVPSKIDIAVPQSVEENLRGRHDDSMGCQSLLPKVRAFPLVRFQRT